MSPQLNSVASIAAIATILLFVSSSAHCQDYDNEGETAITGLSGLSGLSGLTGLAASGAITGYAPIGASNAEASNHNENQQQGAASENSEAEAGDYDEDSNDSSASEMHPILSKVINLISGGRHKRSIPEIESHQVAATKTVHRVKRGSKGYVPYVSTYVKTDKKANFKWGVSKQDSVKFRFYRVKAKVGKKYGRK